MSDLTAIPLDQVKGWAQSSNGPKTPHQIAATCPHCGTWCVFSAGGTHVNMSTGIGSSKSKCPFCDKALGFIYMYQNEVKLSGKLISILSFPAPKLRRPEAYMAEGVPWDVAKAFKNTLNTYQSKNFTATTVMGRRTLEGVLLSLLPQTYNPPDRRKPSLNSLINAVTKEFDFTKPLTQLSHAIRDGGNLGAHFDPAAEPDELMAQQMVELLDYFIAYLFVLPTRIQNLEDAIEREDAASNEFRRLLS